MRIRQFNYYSKKHIDAAFAKYEVDSDLTEWYTPEDIQEKYGMTRVAIRSHVYRNNIPSKKEHGQIFYSKLHFDLSKNSAEESKAEYYTVKEAMENSNSPETRFIISCNSIRFPERRTGASSAS